MSRDDMFEIPEGELVDRIIDMTQKPARAADEGEASRPANTLSTRILLLAAGYLGGCASGAALVGLIWFLVTFNRGDAVRNNPESLISNSRSKAIALAPPFSPPPNTLTAADLAFGETQVERMVTDRPLMNQYVEKGDPIWQYCVRAFAGSACGERIYWDPSNPIGDHYRAMHYGPHDGVKGSIRVRKNIASGFMSGEPIPCEELWSHAVFELENIRNTKAFDNLYRRALKGEVSRTDWIREGTLLEHQALLRTAKDYVPLWKKTADSRSIPSNERMWRVNIPQKYEDWIVAYRDPNGYPWDSVGRYYDQAIVPYLRSQERPRK